MSLSIWIVFSVIGIIDFIMQFQKICKKEKRIYFALFIIYQLLFAFSWLGWIPQHFSKIIKIW